MTRVVQYILSIIDSIQLTAPSVSKVASDHDVGFPPPSATDHLELNGSYRFKPPIPPPPPPPSSDDCVSLAAGDGIWESRRSDVSKRLERLLSTDMRPPISDMRPPTDDWRLCSDSVFMRWSGSNGGTRGPMKGLLLWWWSPWWSYGGIRPPCCCILFSIMIRLWRARSTSAEYRFWNLNQVNNFWDTG